MLSKGKITIILSLCCLCTVSIGFSSWIIGNPASTEANGTIQVDNVISNKDVISNVNNIETFKYTEMGFLNDNNYLTKQGIIIVQLEINLNECERYFISDTTLVVEPVLKYVSESNENLNNIFINNNLVMSYYVSENNVVANDTIWSNLTTSIVSDNNCKSIINITNYLNNDEINIDKIYLSLKYEFSISSGIDFKNTIGQVDDCKFILSTMISSK